jgi:hypothetical protein
MFSLYTRVWVWEKRPKLSAKNATIETNFFIFGCKGTKIMPHMQKKLKNICIIQKKAVPLQSLLIK